MLIFIRGLPGSGKTSLIKLLKKDLDFVEIDPDYISVCNNVSRCKQIEIYKTNLLFTRKALKKDNTVIWSQPWRKIVNIEKTVKKLGSCKTCVIELDCSVDTSWNRKGFIFKTYNDFSYYVSKYQTYNLSYPYLQIGDNYSSDEKIKLIKGFLKNL